MVRKHLLLVKKFGDFVTGLESVGNGHVEVEEDQVIELLWFLVELEHDTFECFKTILCNVHMAFFGTLKLIFQHLKLHHFVICY